MAIPKKYYSRKITVEGESYRWIWYKWREPRDLILLFIQHDGGVGQKLEVLVECNTDYANKYMTNECYDDYLGKLDHLAYYAAPRVVAESISGALKLGWKPLEKGKLFNITCDNGNFFISEKFIKPIPEQELHEGCGELQKIGPKGWPKCKRCGVKSRILYDRKCRSCLCSFS